MPLSLYPTKTPLKLCDDISEASYNIHLLWETRSPGSSGSLTGDIFRDLGGPWRPSEPGPPPGRCIALGAISSADGPPPPPPPYKSVTNFRVILPTGYCTIKGKKPIPQSCPSKIFLSSPIKSLLDQSLPIFDILPISKNLHCKKTNSHSFTEFHILLHQEETNFSLQKCRPDTTLTQRGLDRH